MSKKSQLPYFQFIIFLLSIISILIIFFDFMIIKNKEIGIIIRYADCIICFLFFVDFIKNIIQTKNKLNYLKWGWIDFLSSIPMIEIFRLGRMIRILKIIKLIRLIKLGKLLYIYINKNKSKNVFISACIMFIFIIFIGSICILIIEENNPNRNIILAHDAIWWVVSTMTAVKYVNLYPVTILGKIIGIFLKISGIGLFGIYTGLIVSWFLKD